MEKSPQQNIASMVATHVTDAESIRSQPIAVPLFTTSAYLSFSEWPKEATAACVHACEIHHPSAGRVTAYAKMYRATVGGRGLLNEISAFILGRALGAPMADHGFVCMIPLSRLSSPPSHHKWIRELLAKNKNADFPAFCTSKMDGSDAVIEYLRAGSKVFSEDIRKWRALPLASRFDQHISNTDRHLGNLRRTAKHTYKLFDHGRIVTDDGDWIASDLTSRTGKKNTDSLLLEAWPDGCPAEVVSDILLHLGYHETALTIALPDLRWWWSRLAEPSDAASFEKYLIYRAAELKTMYQTAYGQLPL